MDTRKDNQERRIQENTVHKQEDVMDESMVSSATGVLRWLLCPLAVPWLFGHVLDMFCNAGGKLAIQIAVIVVFASVVIFSQSIVDRTLEKAHDRLPDWAVASLKDMLSADALKALHIARLASRGKKTE